MPKGSAAVTRGRPDEIMGACEELYKVKSFKDITMKDIAEATSLTRSAIYNYFETKEEIFLALLEREYDLWVSELESLRLEHTQLSCNEFSDALARSLQHRELLLKLLSVNLYDLESNVRMERLVRLKRAYKQSLQSLEACLRQYFPSLTPADVHDFLFAFFPFLFGVYPYTNACDKQLAAMKEAGVPYEETSVYKIVYSFVNKLLS
jgi:AcrR family transcriptional regulator